MFSVWDPNPDEVTKIDGEVLLTLYRKTSKLKFIDETLNANSKGERYDTKIILGEGEEDSERLSLDEALAILHQEIAEMLTKGLEASLEDEPEEN